MCPKNPANFNVDNVRVSKILGGGIYDCRVVLGMVLKGDALGTIKHVQKAKVLSPLALTSNWMKDRGTSSLRL